MKKMTNKQKVDFMRQKLSTDAKWAINGMLKIYANQTLDEQRSESTSNLNLIGFTSADARLLSSFSKFFKRHQSLSEKQMNLMFKRMPKYAGQLVKESNQSKLENIILSSIGQLSM